MSGDWPDSQLEPTNHSFRDGGAHRFEHDGAQRLIGVCQHQRGGAQQEKQPTRYSLELVGMLTVRARKSEGGAPITRKAGPLNPSPAT